MARVGWDVSYRKGRLDRRRFFACGNVDYDETKGTAEYLVAIGRHDVRVTPTRPRSGRGRT